MKRLAVLFSMIVMGLAVGIAQSGERVDAELRLPRFETEGLKRSQVMDTMFWLTDRYGPRLSGSPEFEEAGRLGGQAASGSWGVTNSGQGTLPVRPGLVARPVQRRDDRAERDADHRHAEGRVARHQRADHRRRRPTRGDECGRFGPLSRDAARQDRP